MVFWQLGIFFLFFLYCACDKIYIQICLLTFDSKILRLIFMNVLDTTVKHHNKKVIASITNKIPCFLVEHACQFVSSYSSIFFFKTEAIVPSTISPRGQSKQEGWSASIFRFFLVLPGHARFFSALELALVQMIHQR